MTRKELIAQKAEDFAGVNYDCETEADAFYHHIQKEAFVAGAEYADAHPSLYSVTRTREAVEREREYLIRKACEWLKYNFNMPDDFESHFKKAMEK